MLNVADAAATVAWYQGIGFEVVNTYEEDGAINWAWLRRDGTNIMINQRALPREAATGVNLYFDVDDIDALWAELKDRVTVSEAITDQFYGMRDFWIEDPNGTILGFGQPITKPEG
ncbi:MAG: VOC family protein [Kiloniellales bacterium]|nr:VOC family protein [Kiloniellales bacterium]